MDKVIRALKTLDEDDVKIYISLMFDGYEKRKQEHRLFDISDKAPKTIILTYYSCITHPMFGKIYDKFKDKYISDKNFKERYLYNENKLEEVHTKEEQQGLRLVYDYIQKKEDFDNISLYTLSDIHEILYSKTPFPEFGGKYRNDERFLPNTGIDIVSSSLIVHEMNALKPEVDNLVREGIELGNNNNPYNILSYIDKCIELNCKLIKIHPFGDGNGRSVRAFINLLFRLANIPPVYIENKERLEYGEAMQYALGEDDLSRIKQFYFYKICDSIISLDVNVKENNNELGTGKRL